MRAILAAAFALAIAMGSTVAAATGGPPYTLDAKGKCHDSSGKFVHLSLCAGPAAPKPMPVPHCRDPKTGRFVKCGTHAGA